MRRLLVLFFLFLPVLAQAEISVNAIRVATAPVVDGNNSDVAWAKAKPVLITDQAAHETILLSAVYTAQRVYFLVLYPDKAENPLHKPWGWDDAQGKYLEAAHREDTFVFKWNMMDEDVDLSNFADNDYHADVWYWKANRSNLAGFADDKMHILSSGKKKVKTGQEEENSIPLRSLSGKVRYLSRISDTGTAPYQKVARPQVKTNQVVSRFFPVKPTGSRADVQAKGRWVSGFWVVEFSRKLKTGHADDIQFSLDQSPLFGVSIFSLYGKDLDVTSPNLYGMGRISEPLRLNFMP
ncbi:MAG: ethylbenzene dehydrogenase-related protein [Geopsychrobacter sp.]|nr:ethylbenzene dehydrogenase-related protein [Geopsychrobacter sp.]